MYLDDVRNEAGWTLYENKLFHQKTIECEIKFEQWKSRAPPRKSRAPPKMTNLSFFYHFPVRKARHIALIEFKKKNLASISVYHNFFLLIKKYFQTFSSFSTLGSQMNSKFDFNDFFIDQFGSIKNNMKHINVGENIWSLWVDFSADT